MIQNTKIDTVPISKLHPFANHPYKIRENAEMEELIESVKENGILTPLTVRAIGNEQYEIISGHRRLYAAQKAGLQSVPALIYTMTKEEAAIALVDCNLHRENILPSEKAFAYKLKMDALSKQGKRMDLTSSQLGTRLRSDEEIAQSTGESARQIQRYIRLTHLIPEILQYVDDGKIALTPAVELSYLTKQEQYDLFETMESEESTPSLSQAQRMKKLSQAGALTMDRIFDVMTEQKPNQKEKISFWYDEIRSMFPDGYTPKRIYEAIYKMILEQKRQRDEQARRQQRNRSNRDER